MTEGKSPRPQPPAPGLHRCPYCDLDFHGGEYQVITSRASGSLTVITRDPEPDMRIQDLALAELRDSFRAMWGIEPVLVAGSLNNDAETKYHWHVHAQRPDEKEE